MSASMHKPGLLLALSSLLAATLACNAADPGGGGGSEGTRVAVFATITAQMGQTISPPPDGPLISTPGATDPNATGTLPASATPLSTPSVTATPPETRVDAGEGFTILPCRLEILVDGSPSDWGDQPELTPILLDEVTFGATQRSGGNADLSGEARFCWSSTHLYLLVAVTDDIFVQTQTGFSIYKGDEVELVFDGDLRGDFYNTRVDEDDRHFGMSVGDFSDLPPVSVRQQPSQSMETGIEIGGQRPLGQGGNYYLEASIPWSSLGVIPTGGDHYGLCLAISDNDKPAEAVQESFISHCEDLSVFDPSTWITVRLGG